MCSEILQKLQSNEFGPNFVQLLTDLKASIESKGTDATVQEEESDESDELDEMILSGCPSPSPSSLLFASLTYLWRFADIFSRLPKGKVFSPDTPLFHRCRYSKTDRKAGNKGRRQNPTQRKK